MKFLHLFKEAFLSVLDNFFYFLSFLVHKDKNIWVFGSMFGAGYADNSKYFFEYICRHHTEIRAVWFSNNPEVVSSIRNNGYEAYGFYELRGIWTAMKAGAAFISHSGVRDIRPFVFTSSSVLVNLWHGIPLKKIALDDNVSEVRNKLLFLPLKWLSEVLCPGFRRKPDLLTAASVEDQKNFSTAFAFPREKIKITGYPRNDVFFKSKKVGQQEAVKIDRPIKKGIYVPTFRGKENSSYDFFEQFGFDVNRFDRRLGSLGVELYLKLHHFNYPSNEIKNAILHAKHIFFYEKLDAYEELLGFDFLITDFSSIYFDFLLAGRPIIFAPFDRTGFEGEVRQLYYDYNEVTPGPKAQNWQEVAECMAHVVESPHSYSEQLVKTRSRFHQFADGDSCGRVYKEVVTLL